MAAIPIGPLVRFLIAATAAAWSNWDQLSALLTRKEEGPSDDLWGYYLTAVFGMKNYSGTITARERGQVGLHYLNSTGGDLDLTWDTADFEAVESAWTTFFGLESAHFSTDFKLLEYRWYPFGPGVVAPNPPVRVTNVEASNIVGSNAAWWPHQMATTVTLQTALRRHWGRVYLPWMNTSGVAGGQWGTTQTDALVENFGDLLTAPFTSRGILPIVWDRTRKGALGVTAVVVDTVPDVIRRRRPRDVRGHSIYDGS